MAYAIKSHPTCYKGVRFRSRLEARWAAFFDLVSWQWEYEPLDLDGWTPDFRVVFPCGHSECSEHHSLLIEVKPYYSIENFDGHPCLDYPYGFKRDGPLCLDRVFAFCCDIELCAQKKIPADASAAFGINPTVTYWQMSHGAGGGIYNVQFWVDGDVEELWKEAGNRTQWQPRFSSTSLFPEEED